MQRGPKGTQRSDVKAGSHTSSSANSRLLFKANARCFPEGKRKISAQTEAICSAPAIQHNCWLDSSGRKRHPWQLGPKLIHIQVTWTTSACCKQLSLNTRLHHWGTAAPVPRHPSWSKSLHDRHLVSPGGQGRSSPPFAASRRAVMLKKACLLPPTRLPVHHRQ